LVEDDVLERGHFKAFAVLAAKQCVDLFGFVAGKRHRLGVESEF